MTKLTPLESVVRNTGSYACCESCLIKIPVQDSMGGGTVGITKRGKEEMRTRFLFLLFACTFIAFPVSSEDKEMEGKKMDLKVTSTAFVQGAMIPSKYTCDGSDISPPLSWTKGSEGTKSYALISDDPDAPVGTWVHWVMYNLPAGVTSLKEDIPKVKQLANGALQGKNDFGRFGYGGPCPPGGTHRYYFKIYALDTQLGAGPGLTKKQLLKEMEKHILAQGELVGKYSR
jgi:Raf kinase inhibitor-like YbhB/YbcL family protein